MEKLQFAAFFSFLYLCSVSAEMGRNVLVNGQQTEFGEPVNIMHNPDGSFTAKGPNSFSYNKPVQDQNVYRNSNQNSQGQGYQQHPRPNGVHVAEYNPNGSQNRESTHFLPASSTLGQTNGGPNFEQQQYDQHQGQGGQAYDQYGQAYGYQGQGQQSYDKRMYYSNNQQYGNGQRPGQTIIEKNPVGSAARQSYHVLAAGSTLVQDNGDDDDEIPPPLQPQGMKRLPPRAQNNRKPNFSPKPAVRNQGGNGQNNRAGENHNNQEGNGQNYQTRNGQNYQTRNGQNNHAGNGQNNRAGQNHNNQAGKGQFSNYEIPIRSNAQQIAAPIMYNERN